MLPGVLVEAAKRLQTSGPPGVDRKWFLERGIHDAKTMHRTSRLSLHDLLKQNLLETLPGLLRIEDRNAMAFSVENRVPFLTTELVDLVFSLPEEEIISERGSCKAILLRAMESVLPKEILERRDKIGFAMPVAKLNGQVQTWLEESLRDAAAIPPFAALEIERYGKLTLQKRSGDPESQRWLWRWLSLIKWAGEFQVRFE